MKRLNKIKGKEQEIANYVFEKAKEATTDPVFTQYFKKLMKGKGLTVYDLKEDDFYVESLMKSCLRQYQDIYDATCDNYYVNPEKGIFDNTTQPDSKCKAEVDNFIENFESYGKDVKELFNDEFFNKIK